MVADCCLWATSSHSRRNWGMQVFKQRQWLLIYRYLSTQRCNVWGHNLREREAHKIPTCLPEPAYTNDLVSAPHGVEGIYSVGNTYKCFHQEIIASYSHLFIIPAWYTQQIWGILPRRNSIIEESDKAKKLTRWRIHWENICMYICLLAPVFPPKKI